ncbi:hypothetical protein [Winogradskyella alexanderae]|uniref:Uncharacterized protein n=1 Tax=Winogradskyella alexanderae TaxID=2877123 RepID=A0ABS7XV79_9FLAO|nr:hypothetical protein [Winogradskyella alexanderae]MCA0133343.1 hypothetical protein [Winogradskyella alexanderae]
MNKILYFLFLFCGLCFSQNTIKANFIDSMVIDVQKIFGVDTFGTMYYSTDDNTFNKRTKDTTITYTNYQLAEITSANAFNPLKINLFYSDFNTVIILDNRLAEVYKVDFNTVVPYKNVTYISTGFDNTIWIYNQDLQQLELYDYKTNKIRLKTVPLQSEALDLKSDYNYCYLLTENYLYIYNYFGSLVNKFENIGYDSLAFSKAHLILKEKNQLHILTKNNTEIKRIQHPNLLISQFLVTNETLYIYNDGILRQYRLKLE